jgi:hypothetical protein
MVIKAVVRGMRSDKPLALVKKLVVVQAQPPAEGLRHQPQQLRQPTAALGRHRAPLPHARGRRGGGQAAEFTLYLLRQDGVGVDDVDLSATNMLNSDDIKGDEGERSWAWRTRRRRTRRRRTRS